MVITYHFSFLYNYTCLNFSGKHPREQVGKKEVRDIMMDCKIDESVPFVDATIGQSEWQVFKIT